MDIQGSVTAKSIITAGLRVNEGFNTQTLLGDFDLSKHSHKTQYYFTQEDRVVTLPDATTLPSGWSISFFSNKLSTGTVFINDKDGNEQYKVKPNKSVSLILLDNTTQAGVWKVIESGSGTGAGDRNITILSEEPLFSVEGTSVNVNRFVASVSNGFEEDGTAIEEIIEFPGGSALTNPDSFPKTSYVYLTLEGVLIQEDAKQDGGNDFPENPSTGYIFYNKQLRKNFKYEENEWVDYPCVAVGEVTWTSDTEIKTTTYTFNEWWWDFVEFMPLVSHVQRFINNEEVTTQIVLDTKCEDKNYLTINVSNTVLMADTYDLASDGVTVSFINAIEAGVPIEAKWYIPVSAVSVTTTGANTDLSNLTAVGNEKLLPMGGRIGDVVVRSENGARWAPTTGMTIGTVFMSDLVAPNIPAGALEYNGTEVTQADEQYPEFWSNWLTAGKFATVTYQQYDTELSTNGGTCAFYALDVANKKFKTPTWADGVFAASAITATEVNKYYKDQFQGHHHNFHYHLSTHKYVDGNLDEITNEPNNIRTDRVGDPITDGKNGEPRTGAETFPKHVRKRWFVQVANAVESTAYQNIDTALQSKVNKSGDTMTGALNVPTPSSGSNNTTVPTTAWVRSYGVAKTGDTIAGILQINTAGNELRFIHPDYPDYFGFIRRSNQNLVIGTKTSDGSWLKALFITDTSVSASATSPDAYGNEVATANWVRSYGVNKSGDTMSGQLTLAQGAKITNGFLEFANGIGIRLLKKDGTNYYALFDGSDGILRLFDIQENNGFYLERLKGNSPHYFDGKKGYELAYIKEKYSDGNGNWYRVWSDGWVEQGGTYPAAHTAVTFLKPFANTNYTFIISGNMNAGNKTTTSISFDPNFTVASKAAGYWYACGQGAE